MTSAARVGDRRRAWAPAVLLIALGALVELTFLVVLALDAGSRHLQIALSWAAQSVLYAAFAWQIVRLSKAPGLDDERRRFWRIVTVTGVASTCCFVAGFGGALRARDESGTVAGAASGVFGVVATIALVAGFLTYRSSKHSNGKQMRAWLDALVTLIAGVGALWFVEANSLLATGVSLTTVVSALVVNALSLVIVLALLKPLTADVRPISTRTAVLALVAIGVTTAVEIAAPHAAGTPWLRLVLAVRLITPILITVAMWLEPKTAGPAGNRPRRLRGFSRVPYFAVGLTYTLLGLTLGSRGAAGQTWGMYAAATAVTLLVVLRQILAFRDNAVLVAELRDAVDASSRLTVQLKHHAFYDDLTGLPNRSLFTGRLAEALASGARVGVMVLDLDDFKTINDRAGHAAGDEVLREVGERLRACVRDGDTVARLGGDEFAVVLLGADELSVAATADRIVEAISTAFALADGPAAVGISVGTALSVPGVTDVVALLRNADIAMYVAKAAGKAQHASFRPDMLATAMAELDLRDALSRATADGELVVLYQPIVDATTHAVVALEALVRWQRPGVGLLSPDAFLAQAEQMGLIGDVDAFVLRSACHATAELNAGRGEAVGVHVNVSATTVAEPGFLGLVREALADSGLPAALLTVELTETAVMTNADEFIAVMRALRATGVRVAIDDFGTGYSSLAYLRDLPLDAVKIDRSFVRELSRSPVDRELVRMIVSLAEVLGLDTVAEGVENAEQAEFLSEMGCRHMQGYLFSPSVPMDAHRPTPGALHALR